MSGDNKKATEAALEKLIEAAIDPAVGASHPTGMAFLPSDIAVFSALFAARMAAGSPVAVIYPDGRELIVEGLGAGSATAGTVASFAPEFVYESTIDDLIESTTPATRYDPKVPADG